MKKIFKSQMIFFNIISVINCYVIAKSLLIFLKINEADKLGLQSKFGLIKNQETNKAKINNNLI